MILQGLLLSLICLFCTTDAAKYFAQPKGYCLASDSNPYVYYSTKTSYDQVRGTAGSDTDCKPIQYWSLGRHGTRYAKEETLIEMSTAEEMKKVIIKNYEDGNVPVSKALCSEDLDAIAEWEWDGSIETQGNDLTMEGWRELRQIAQRYKMRYPTLFSNYSEEHFYFRHTTEERTYASCRAFIEGLFGSYDNVKIEEPQLVDEVIRPYANCPAWSEAVDDNDDFKKEQKRIFRKEADYLKLLDDVTARLGYKKTLKHDDIDIMYDVCRYNKAWYPGQVSPWCSVFSKWELFLMDYYEDIATYYKSGYSHEFHPKLGCMPLKYLMETFEKTIQSKEAKPRVTALFSHDTLINMVLTTLGFGKDDQPLMGSDYEDLLVNRKFRSSLNVPFASNIAAILHECSTGDYQVQFFLNERPMEIKGCPMGLCSWEHLSNMLSMTKTCNLDFCNL